jgi:ribose 5-phosphate isomerase
MVVGGRSGPLGQIAKTIPGAVATSYTSARALQAVGISVLNPKAVSRLCVHVDGADEIDSNLALINRGGAALTREKYSAVWRSSLSASLMTRSASVTLACSPLPMR